MSPPRARLIPVLAALALLAAACSVDRREADEPSTTIFDPELVTSAPEVTPFEELDVITVATSGAIASFNTSTATGDVDWARMIMQTVWPVGTRILPDFTVEPVFFTRLPQIVSQDPFVVEYQLRPDALWSDGVPVSVDDLRFYVENCNSRGVFDEEGLEVEAPDDCVNISSYDQIRDFAVINSQTVDITFAAPNDEYLTLFSDPMPPAHVGADWSQGFERFDERLVLAAGPFKIVGDQSGVEVQLVRNESWFGDRPLIEGLRFRVIEDEFAQIGALDRGEVDLIYLDAQVNLLRAVDELRGIKTNSSFGLEWEQLTFNHDTVGGRERQAIVRALDRDAIARNVVRPFGPGGRTLGSRVFVNGQTFYADNTPGPYLDDSAKKARETLRAAGYVENETGMFVDEDERPLTFRIRTTGGNARREQVEQLIRLQLGEAGIQVVVDNLAGPVALGPIFVGDFDLAVFSWEGSPQAAGFARRIYTTGSPANAGSFSNSVVDDKLAIAVVAQDSVNQARLLNEADAIMWNLLPNVPLYQVPTLLAYDDGLTGIEDNATRQGITWDITSWARLP
ncbi:MAG: ABC transporter substrate-binding protein [Acidimicrobiales bacterium]